MSTDTGFNIEPAKKKNTATKSNMCGNQLKVSTRSAANQSSQGVSGKVKVAEVGGVDMSDTQAAQTVVHAQAVKKRAATKPPRKGPWR